MTWTIDRPEKPGWYWTMFSVAEGTAEVVELDENDEVWRASYEDPWDVSDFDEWWDVRIKRPGFAARRYDHDDEA